MALTIGEAGSVRTIALWFTGHTNGTGQKVTVEQLAAALQMLDERAGRVLQMMSHQAEIAAAAAGVAQARDTVAGLTEQWAVETEEATEHRPDWDEDRARDWASADDTAVVKRRLVSEWVVR